MPIYGLELWFNQNIQKRKIFKNFEVAEMCHQFLLNHYVMQKQAKFLISVNYFKIPIFMLNKIFINNCLFCKKMFNNLTMT